MAQFVYKEKVLSKKKYIKGKNRARPGVIPNGPIVFKGIKKYLVKRKKLLK
jgi:hypothetical protein